MNSNRGRLPNWVKEFMTPNQRIRREGGKYLLYDVVDSPGSSKREILVGEITPNGIKHKEEAHKEIGSFSVYEYGASKVLMDICPSKWKSLRGPTWRQDLLTVIFHTNPKSYLVRSMGTRTNENIHLIKNKLDIFLKKEFQTSVDEIFKALGDIYVIYDSSSNNQSLTKPSENQITFLNRLGLNLEAML